MRVYALLDDGSDACFMAESLKQELGVDGVATGLELSTIHHKSYENTERISGLVLASQDNENIELPSVYVRETLPSSIEEIPTPAITHYFDHLRPLENDISPLMPDSEVKILIGNNCPRALCPINVIKGKNNEPYGVRTELGWGIIGPRPVNNSTYIQAKTRRIGVKEIMHMFNIDMPSSVNENHALGLSANDKEFIKQLEDSIVQLEDGKYMMSLPLKDKDIKLPMNRILAERRLHSLKRKLLDENFKKDYLAFMADMIDRGYAEEIKEDGKPGEIWYLPHHGVYHPKKQKMRVVFDCSAVFHGIALNSILISSPDLTCSVVGVLIRFRQEKIAFVGDLEGMFLQVVVTPQHRNLLRFLWWENGDCAQSPKVYRMTRHLFGASSSPGCANFALRRTADDYGERVSPRAAKFIHRNFYMDDGCGSVETEREAIEMIQELQQLCSKGGFRFHKLLSTSAEVIHRLKPEDRASGLKHFDTQRTLPIERALGIEWCVESDEFQFRVIVECKPFTRRGILSTLCSVYDPLGLMAPFVMSGKIILQELCREHFKEADWDDPVPEKTKGKWTNWLSGLASLSENTISIPRCYKPKDLFNLKSIEMHHFSDASTLGYGHVTYLRFLYGENKIHCSILFGKARVRPLKEITIPRLELTAAVSAAKASEFLSRELDYQVQRFFWTDSKVVLGYIFNKSKRFHLFVTNRIQCIRDCSNPEDWRYVPSKFNPADYVSRGLNIEELRSSRWFIGPEFLWKEKLIEGKEEYIISPNDPELRKEATSREVRTIENDKIIERMCYWSSWYRLLVAFATAVRYVKRLKNKFLGYSVQTGIEKLITLEEIKEAKVKLLVMLQAEGFSEDVANLKNGKKLKGSSSLLKLNPILDDQGLLRVGGRIKHTTFNCSEQHPIILPKKKHLTTLIIKYFHHKNCHQGRGITLGAIRQGGYWVIGGATEVARCIRTCIVCKRFRGRSEEQMMSDLPPERLTPAPPFTFSSADVFGPFFVKQGRAHTKRYGIVFTCLCCRAVHLDVLDSLDTSSFINSLRRFICRRGQIKFLRTDAGTNFVGGKEELRKADTEINKDEVVSFLTEKQCKIEFKTCTPKASHTQGAVERMIGTIRRILEYQLENYKGQLNEDCLRTLFIECESIVNNRPLTVESCSDTELTPLSPSNLLYLREGSTPAPPGYFSEETYTKKRWRRVQMLADQFWSRWRKEYMQTLQIRSKWTKPRRNVTKGDIVLCKEENLPRNAWPLGIVEEAYIAEDGLVRKLKIRLGRGVYRERPVTAVIVLIEADGP